MKRKSSENKFVRIVKMPIRALGKAMDYYVRKMNQYADMGTCDGLGWGGPVYAEPMPRSLSETALRTTTEIDRDLKELVRRASTGSLVMSNHSRFVSNASTTTVAASSSAIVVDTKLAGSGLSNCCSKGVVVPRCASVVMAKIEEDEPSSYDDVDVVVEKKKSKVGLFPRCRCKGIGETRRTRYSVVL